MLKTDRFISLLFLAFCLVIVPSHLARAGDPIEKINHVIVIYQENWSFDGLYGKFPGANGLENASKALPQVDKENNPLTFVPRPIDNSKNPDSRFPEKLPAQPYDLAQYVPMNQKSGDLVHRFYQNQLQINGGRMDKYAAWSDNPGLVMSYYDASDLPEGRLAKQYALLDNFYQGAFGGSFLNHFWMVCACAPEWPDAPENVRIKLDSNGVLAEDNLVTPDGFAVNTAYSVNQPHPKDSAPGKLVPMQNKPTIGDRLSEKNISWAWYSGGWDDALAGNPDKTFQFHHQPFAFFANYADGTPAKAAHLKDEKDFLAALKDKTLPSVSFIKPIGANNEHPGYASLMAGQEHVSALVKAIQDSPYWKDAAIIITYDENGGRWDHVPPPHGDRWGPGTRIPAIIVSPYAKRGYIDHTLYDTTSILKFIEKRWGLAPFGSRDQAAKDLTQAFDFSQDK
ncbi:MAG: acid phosphatase [Nitrospirae bacterium]|nr:acid phosphatase [Nitrospirota bacterium]